MRKFSWQTVHRRRVRAGARYTGRQHVKRERTADVPELPPPPPKFSGRSVHAFGLNDGALLRDSVLSCAASAVIVTVSDVAPTSSVTSTRLVMET